MLTVLTDFVVAYWYYILAVAVLCGITCIYSPTFYRNFKKGMLLLLVVLVLALGYEFLTGRSILTIPSRIDKKLSEKPTRLEPSHRYYPDLDQIPKD